MSASAGGEGDQEPLQVVPEKVESREKGQLDGLKGGSEGTLGVSGQLLTDAVDSSSSATSKGGYLWKIPFHSGKTKARRNT